MSILHKVKSRLAEGELLPWRWTHLGGFSNTMIRAPFRRRQLVRHIHKRVAPLPEEVTVVIGVKNRVDFKLANTLHSLRLQKPNDLIVRIIVVDYDNEQAMSEEIERLCRQFDAAHVKVTGRPQWNKSHCINIGIRMAQTKYLLSADADIIFAPNYLATAVDELQKQPLSVIYSQMLDLPESSIPELEVWADSDGGGEFDQLRKQSLPRSSGDCNAGINMSYTYFYNLIRGYDEFYTQWGSEDNDLQKRFTFLGLESVSVKDRTFYLHQWHDKYASLDPATLDEAIAKNTTYLKNSNSIVRNRVAWGEL